MGNQQFTMRPAVLDDVEIIHKLEQSVAQHYYGVEGMTFDRIYKEYTTPGFQINKSIQLMFTEKDDLVGLVEVWDITDPPVHPYIYIRVDPEYEQQGLQLSLLAWAEQRASQVLERVDNSLRVSLRVYVDHGMNSTRDSLLEMGMKQIRRSCRMRRELKSPPRDPVFPEGIHVREYIPDEDAYAVYLVDEEVFRDHFGFIEDDPQVGFERFLHHMTGDDSYDPSLWFVAEEDGEIVGVCLCRTRGYDEPNAGYISSLGVRRPWRRRGIALGLLQCAFIEFHNRGYASVDLGVDAQNLTGAMGLYQKAGMYVFREFDLYEKELRPGQEVSVTSLSSSES